MVAIAAYAALSGALPALLRSRPCRPLGLSAPSVDCPPGLQAVAAVDEQLASGTFRVKGLGKKVGVAPRMPRHSSMRAWEGPSRLCNGQGSGPSI